MSERTSNPCSSRARAALIGRFPVQPSGSAKRGLAKMDVVVNATVPAATCKSSTANTSVTRRSGPCLAQWTTRSTASLTSAESAAALSSDPVSASWQTNLRRDRACRADPAWMVVNPWTPDDSVSRRGRDSALPRLLPRHSTAGQRHFPTPRGGVTPSMAGLATRFERSSTSRGVTPVKPATLR